MRMIIDKFFDFEGKNIIKGHTSVGEIQGVWCGKNEPYIGEEIFFELSMKPINRRSIVIEKDEKKEVSYISPNVLFKGMCDSVDEIYYIRYSDDWLEMIEVEDDDYMIHEGDYVKFEVPFDEISIFPYYI